MAFSRRSWSSAGSDTARGREKDLGHKLNCTGSAVFRSYHKSL